jgi:hypothetical protein
VSQRAGRKASQSAERRSKALELRIAGASFEQIGQALGIATSAAWKHVTSALDQTKAKLAENAERVRAIEVRRLDAIVMSLWGRRSDPRHADTILRAMDRRARLLGLDAPTRAELSGPGGGPIVQTTSDLAGLTNDELGQLETLVLKGAQPKADPTTAPAPSKPEP